MRGSALVRASWAGTLAFAVTAVSATAVRALDLVALAVALGLFVAGTALFAAAFVLGVSRSRTHVVGVLAMFLLEGKAAPRDVRRLLLASFAVEVLVGAGTAALRPNTSVAFGILAPVYGLALAGLWGARHGTFPPRPPAQPRRATRPAGPAARGDG